MHNILSLTADDEVVGPMPAGDEERVGSAQQYCIAPDTQLLIIVVRSRQREERGLKSRNTHKQ